MRLCATGPIKPVASWGPLWIGLRTFAHGGNAYAERWSTGGICRVATWHSPSFVPDAQPELGFRCIDRDRISRGP
jgi:hypothetical protein